MMLYYFKVLTMFCTKVLRIWGATKSEKYLEFAQPPMLMVNLNYYSMYEYHLTLQADIIMQSL